MKRRSPRSGTITGSTSWPSMRCVGALPQPHIVLPEARTAPEPARRGWLITRAAASRGTRRRAGAAVHPGPAVAVRELAAGGPRNPRPACGCARRSRPGSPPPARPARLGRHRRCCSAMLDPLSSPQRARPVAPARIRHRAGRGAVAGAAAGHVLSWVGCVARVCQLLDTVRNRQRPATCTHAAAALQLSGSTGFRRTRGRAPAAAALLVLLATACRQARRRRSPPPPTSSGAPYPDARQRAAAPAARLHAWSSAGRSRASWPATARTPPTARPELDYATGRTSTTAATAGLGRAGRAAGTLGGQGARARARRQSRGRANSSRTRSSAIATTASSRTSSASWSGRFPGAGKGQHGCCPGPGCRAGRRYLGQPVGELGPARFGGFLGGSWARRHLPTRSLPGPWSGMSPSRRRRRACRRGGRQLARALAKARDAAASLRITGGGSLAEARTRAVADALTRLGAAPGQLDVAPGGEGEDVRLTLTPRRGA